MLMDFTIGCGDSFLSEYPKLGSISYGDPKLNSKRFVQGKVLFSLTTITIVMVLGKVFTIGMVPVVYSYE
jgi:hypothetical protein